MMAVRERAWRMLAFSTSYRVIRAVVFWRSLTARPLYNCGNACARVDTNSKRARTQTVSNMPQRPAIRIPSPVRTSLASADSLSTGYPWNGERSPPTRGGDRVGPVSSVEKWQVCYSLSGSKLKRWGWNAQAAFIVIWFLG
jgi:hypothetical protein